MGQNNKFSLWERTVEKDLRRWQLQQKRAVAKNSRKEGKKMGASCYDGEKGGLGS